MKWNVLGSLVIFFILLHKGNLYRENIFFSSMNFCKTVDEINVGAIDKKILLGQYRPELDSNFCKVPKQYASRDNIFLHKQCYGAFLSMYAAAQKDSINLIIVSGFRSFEYQKGIWEAKWNGQRLVEGKNLAQMKIADIEKVKMILRFSAMPGTSRHHWGTDIDLNSVDAKYFASGKGKKVLQWLEKNAANYGFYRPYTVKDNLRPFGHEAEEWHWSYVPLSKKMLEQFNNTISYGDLVNYSGAACAKELDVIANYVNGIHPSCK